jgi:hypothetical protein
MTREVFLTGPGDLEGVVEVGSEASRRKSVSLSW